MPINDFAELLRMMTVDSKDDGKEFTVRDRLSVIGQLLAGSNYRQVVSEPLALGSLPHSGTRLRAGFAIFLRKNWRVKEFLAGACPSKNKIRHHLAAAGRTGAAWRFRATR